MMWFLKSILSLIISIQRSQASISRLADRILRWQPMYILGRLTYCVYLGHFTLLMSKAAVTRTPVYVNYILIIHNVIGDLIMSYILAFFITILLEMPISSLQRLFIPPPSINDENKNK
ncbi:uncharacterized protein LOC130443369 [Diorhabda sublineata]|uniref:uncharacterized protein LOC130443369 n=1 Tax=Diorhabda sublineata TaxID=1163346 RepID=UPI0024E0AC2A|nr:uncharacterized protein LOC130443369 [Diorhabda sublineata]